MLNKIEGRGKNSTVVIFNRKYLLRLNKFFVPIDEISPFSS